MNRDNELEDLRGQLQETRAQLAHSEKMATLGALAAGIAHELNNPIGFVKNNMVMLEEYLKVLLPVLRKRVSPTTGDHGDRSQTPPLTVEGEDLPAILDDIEPLMQDALDGAVRLEEIVIGLRRFARADSPEGEPFNLNQCVADTLKVAWNELKYKAEVIQDLQDTPPLSGKPGEINQVILNLLVNAAQAIDEAGHIDVTARIQGDTVQLEVCDDGEGIATEHMNKLFTPFFTTRAVGDGIGLGLAICHGIVQRHGGDIRVDSTPGAGSRFLVSLPIPSLAQPTAMDPAT